MVDERGAQARTHGAGVTGKLECSYYGRLQRRGNGAAARADRRAAAVEPPYATKDASRIGWFKPDGAQRHDGQGHHAGRTGTA